MTWLVRMLQWTPELQCPQKLKLKLNYDRQSGGQSVLVSGIRLGPRDQFFFLLEIFFRQLRVCYFVAPSLTRGQVCNLLLLLVLTSAVPLGPEPRGTKDHILLSQFLRLPQPGGPGPCIYIPQEQGGPDIPPGTGFHFRRLLRLTGLWWRYSILPLHGSAPKNKSQSHVTTDGQSGTLVRGWVYNLQCNDASSISRYIATDGLSASSSWFRAPWPDFNFFVWQFLSSQCRAPSPISPNNRVKVKFKRQSYVSVGKNF
jgi:hypothetical protein